ncbi:MAG: prepilin-type N-terminal cleavage/methylation domain-containing protein [Candidatus Falkowbacteria bacterium]
MKGFTLIELFIVMGIFVVLASVAMPVYGGWLSAAQLDAAIAETVSGLRRARTFSIAGKNDSAHGIYFSIDPAGADAFVLYQGSSYATRETGHDLETALPGSLEIVFDGSNEINFSNGSGEPDAAGTITITHIGSGEAARITVNNLGIIE